MSVMKKSLWKMIGVAAMAILIAIFNVGCGGNDPTGPKPDPTPIPSPTPNPTPTPGPIGDSIVFRSANPVANSTLIFGQNVSFSVKLTTAASQFNVSAYFSEDGSTVSPWSQTVGIGGYGEYETGCSATLSKAASGKTLAVIFVMRSGATGAELARLVAPLVYNWREASANSTFTLTDAGISPKAMTVKVGDTVTFVNKSSDVRVPTARNSGYVYGINIAPGGQATYSILSDNPPVINIFDRQWSVDERFEATIAVVK